MAVLLGGRIGYFEGAAGSYGNYPQEVGREPTIEAVYPLVAGTAPQVLKQVMQEFGMT